MGGIQSTNNLPGAQEVSAPQLIADNLKANIDMMLNKSSLVMNMEDSSTDDFDLMYRGFNNLNGQSLSADTLFTEQKNPAFVMDEYLKALQSIVGCSSNDSYIELSAYKKRRAIWHNVIADTSSPDWINVAGIFLESMETTFSAEGDYMPCSLTGNRKKYIHQVGRTGKVNFVSNGNHEFTGMLTGGFWGIVRFSSAAEPSANQPLAPGMGLKFLRNGMDSANLVAMFSTNGQPSWNFFENTWKTWIPPVQGAALTALACKFSTATPHPGNVGLTELASFDGLGNRVEEPKVPFGLKFKPTDQVKGTFDRINGGQSFVSYHEYMDTLGAIPADATLFDVYAVDQPDGPETLIGTLNLEHTLTTSKFGDQSLFFRHQKKEDDFDLNP